MHRGRERTWLGSQLEISELAGMFETVVRGHSEAFQIVGRSRLGLRESESGLCHDDVRIAALSAHITILDRD
jgi:hypothetical protein